MRELTYNEAAVEAVAEEMRLDPKIFYMSTDPIPPLLKEFGPQRIKATPIAEAALTGMGIGAAGSGFRLAVALFDVHERCRAEDVPAVNAL
jgi:pyruvate/2-oxoglutarate/acetoin dehydrogenase E1 component